MGEGVTLGVVVGVTVGLGVEVAVWVGPIAMLVGVNLYNPNICRNSGTTSHAATQASRPTAAATGSHERLLYADADLDAGAAGH
jgi:hypothetical protein